MSTRFAKQLVYAAFYAVIWVLVIWAGYYIFARPAPPPPAAPVVAPIAILGVNAFATPASAGYDTFLAEVANPNADYAAQGFDYSFNVYNASGTLIQSFPGQSFLYGSEVKYLLLVNQQVASSVATFDLTIPTSTIYWAASSTFGPTPSTTVQNISTQATGTTVVASGQLVDQDTASFNDILIVAIFKDANGNPIGASQTELDSIAPGQTENFSVSYPALAGINPTATEVEAYALRQ